VIGKQELGITEHEITNDIYVGSGTCWVEVMLQFAKFLDSTGYVGVFDKMSRYAENEWDFGE
jgi:hypothetical protein